MWFEPPDLFGTDPVHASQTDIMRQGFFVPFGIQSDLYFGKLELAFLRGSRKWGWGQTWPGQERLLRRPRSYPRETEATAMSAVGTCGQG